MITKWLLTYRVSANACRYIFPNSPGKRNHTAIPVILIPECGRSNATSSLYLLFCFLKEKDPKLLGSVQGYSDVRIKAKQWMDGDTNHTYSQWKAMAPKKSAEGKAGTGESRSEARKRYLMEKYGRKWRERTKRSESTGEKEAPEEEWLRQVLFTPSNRAARQMACTMIESLCQVWAHC